LCAFVARLFVCPCCTLFVVALVDLLYFKGEQKLNTAACCSSAGCCRFGILIVQKRQGVKGERRGPRVAVSNSFPLCSAHYLLSLM